LVPRSLRDIAVAVAAFVGIEILLRPLASDGD
jgi:hypothetical protein